MRINPLAFRLTGGPAVAIGILIIPLFDTIRVFTTRILRGSSPFEADRRHIHHLLIDYGFTHMHATGVLVTVNIFYICLVLGLDGYLNMHTLILLELALASAGTYYLHREVNIKKMQSPAVR